MFSFIPSASFLHDFFSALQKFCLSSYLVFDRAFHRAKGVEVFYFNFCSELSITTKRDICFHAHLSFFHVGLTRLQRAQEHLQLACKITRLFRARNDRLGHELHEGYPRAVVIDGSAYSLLMHRTCRILFEMYPCYRNAVQFSTGDKRVFVLAQLVALWEIGVKIILAIEFCVIRKTRAERKPDAQDKPDRFPVDDRQGPRMRHAYGADVYIWFESTCIVLGIAEHLGLRLEFCVNLQADGGNVLIHESTLSSNLQPPKRRHLPVSRTSRSKL